MPPRRDSGEGRCCACAAGASSAKPKTDISASFFPFTRSPVHDLLLLINLRPTLLELARLLRHSALQRLVLGQPLLLGILAHVLRDLHRAEVRAAHRAEVRELCALLRQ